LKTNNKKTILLYSFETSDWASCRKIVSNLIASYSLALDDIIHLDFSRLQNERSLLTLTETILAHHPERIIFADHQPHPADLLAYLLVHLPRSTEIIVHAYGDFLFPYPEKWLKLNKSLIHRPLKVISASDRHASMLGQFFHQAPITTCPFPVDTKSFCFEPAARTSKRLHLKVQNQFCWLYTGRLSQQKNILPLIESFARYLERSERNDQLWLAGPFDSMGVPYLNILPMDHEFYYDYQKLLRRLSPKAQSNIRYLGILYNEELNQLYSAADGFVSLSTHNDEDYGMAVAEALSTGLPCVLTDWAGYSDFRKYAPTTTALIRVKFVEGQLQYDDQQLARALLKMSSTPHLRQSNCYLGFPVVADRLRQILQQESFCFTGFNQKLTELCQAWEQMAFSTQDQRYNRYYFETYRSYFEELD
jgi:glycosyltransferase involved in cell wall biosynthesis